MRCYVGIDVAKSFHVAALVDTEGEVIRTVRFDNDAAGYAELRQALAPYAICDTPIALESTGHYGRSLRDWLVDQGHCVHVFNPLKTSRFRDFYVQWRKNDERDAIALAHLLYFGERQPYHAFSIPLRSLRQMVRHRALLVQARARMKNQIRAIVDEVFPEYQQVPLFSDIFGATSLALLRDYPTPASIKDVPGVELTDFLRRHSRGQIGAKQARQIVATAQRSVGSAWAGQAYAPIIPTFIGGYQELASQITVCTNDIQARLAQMDQTLTTIPGCGPIVAATILSEIGQVERFPSADHLVSFCGLALSGAQSGQSPEYRFLSRRGSPRLRCAFYQAALVVIKYDPALSAYYQRRVRQGMTKRRAVLAVARKLVRITYALLKSGAPYEPR
jgi:transposase